MKKIIAILFLFIVTEAIAQQTMKDVVYLKNGSIIRGMIIEQIPNESIKIKTGDGNVILFKMDEIQKITKEDVTPETKTKPEKENTPDESKFGFSIEPKLFFAATEIISGNYNDEPALYYTSTFQCFPSLMVNAEINRNFYIGIGIQIAPYSTLTAGNFPFTVKNIYDETNQIFYDAKISGTASDRTTLTYINFPLSLNFKTGHSNKPGFYTSFGPYVGALVAAEESSHINAIVDYYYNGSKFYSEKLIENNSTSSMDGWSSYDAGMFVAIGVCIPVSKTISLNIAPRFQIGFVDANTYGVNEPYTDITGTDHIYKPYNNIAIGGEASVKIKL